MIVVEEVDIYEAWMAAMRAGDYERAWRETDRIEIPRRCAGERAARHANQLCWDGTPFDDAVVLIRCCHGFGDAIQFVRYLPLVRERARRVIMRVQPELGSLFRLVPGIDELIAAWEPPDPPSDVEIECMELPYAFRSTLKTIPREVPYLPAERLPRFALGGGGDKLKVGIVWAAGEWKPDRSMRLADFAPLAELGHVELFSMQQGPRRVELEHAQFPIYNLAENTRDIAVAAEALLELDLLIAVDTMAVHLAGALGVPVWTLLTRDADWRWMTDRSDSPWYPSMRLFRQGKTHSWDAVMKEVAGELRAYRRQ